MARRPAAAATATAADAAPAAARAPLGADPSAADDPLAAEERELAAFARLLDSSIRLPGGFRIGWDGIIGLVPGIGDVAGLGLSGYLVWRASRLGLPRATLARMIGNVALETAIGAVPILGDAFDFAFKANNRNVRLMRRALAERRTVPGPAARR